jgi:hypothetical protein
MRPLLLLLLVIGCTSKTAVPPMDTPDLAGLDGGTIDMMELPDLTAPPAPPSPVWIGSGGAAKSAAQSLQVQIGRGGRTSAPSGARFTSGFFGSLAE